MSFRIADHETHVNELFKHTDWSLVGLPPKQYWPTQLQLAADLCLSAPSPAMILWGKDHHQIYNQQYAAIIGNKHPAAFGAPSRHTWPEAWHLIEPILEGVRNSKKGSFVKDMMFPLNRNGYLEETYFNTSYTPILVNDEVAGIYINCLESTESVVAQRNVIAIAEKNRDLVAQLMSLMDAIPQIVWVTDDNGEVTYFNERWYDLTGLSMMDSIPHGWSNVLHEEDKQRTLDVWTSSVKTGQLYNVEYRLRTKSDEYRWFLAMGVPVRDENGKITKWFGTCTDIHDRKMHEEQKDDFISIASHELKTPLTHIKARMQIAVRQTPHTEQNYPHISKSLEQVLRIERLVSDLLDVSKINAGKLMYNIEAFNFADMVKESVDNFQHSTTTHRIILEQNDRITVHGDRLRLEQVMHNLLSNAVKYSPDADRVVVRSRINKKNIIICVQDFGIGIERNSMVRLFERYYRVDNTAMRYQGLGLGLYITNEIVKRHNGSLWIESEPGLGSIFYFLLPVSGNAEIEEYEDSSIRYRADHIEMEYDHASKILMVDWIGHQNMHSVQKGGMRMLEMLKANKAHKVLNDNTNVMGNWSEASDWAREAWFPMMAAAGLTHFAWIYSPSEFAKLAANMASASITQSGITVQFFEDKETALSWLRTVK